jgi:hypothetical protein
MVNDLLNAFIAVIDAGSFSGVNPVSGVHSTRLVEIPCLVLTLYRPPPQSCYKLGESLQWAAFFAHQKETLDPDVWFPFLLESCSCF